MSNDNYKRIQIIGVLIDTMPSRRDYLGLDPAEEDILERVTLIRATLEWAQLCISASWDAPEGEVLKVFVIPEFFFRGTEGCYTKDQAKHLEDGLRDCIAGDEWRDWVVVFGTIVRRVKAGEHGVDNYALVQRGGPDGRYQHVSKAYMSGSDFVKDEAGDHYAYQLTPGPGADQSQDPDDGRAIFELAGVTFGIEVCLDHKYDKDPARDRRRLWRSPQIAGSKAVQVQIVPSAGMKVYPEAVVTVGGGVVYNCDGRGRLDTLLYRVKEPSSRDPDKAAVLEEDKRFKTMDPLIFTDFRRLYKDREFLLHIHEPGPMPPAEVVR